MKTKRKFIYVLLIFMMGLLSGCSTVTSTINGIKELDSEKYDLGGTAGTAAADMLVEQFTNCEIKYFNQLADGYLAVQKGKLDGFTYNRPNLDYVVAGNPDLFVLPESLGTVDIVVGTKLGNDELMQKVTGFIADYLSNGTYDDMYNRWIKEAKEDMPIQNPSTGENLTVGLDALNQPFNYIKDGEVVGFDAEFAYRLANHLGMKVKFEIMNYDVLVPAGISGKIDLIISNMNATPERRENMLLSEPYLVSDVALIIRRDMYSGVLDTDYKSKLETATVGVMTGSLGETVIEAQYPKAQRRSFDNYSDILAALKASKIDFMIANETTLQRFVMENPNLEIVGEPLTNEGASVAVAKGNSALLDKIDSLLSQYKEDGTLEEIVSHWIKTDGSVYSPIDVPKRESGETIKIAISADMEPMCFVLDNEFAGIDIELARKLCYDMGYIPEFQNMKFAGIIASLQSGKSDAIISNMTRTDERALTVDFSQQYFLNPQMLLAQKNENSLVPEFAAIQELEGKNLGCITGSVMFENLKKQVNVTPKYYNSNPDLLQVLLNKKVDAIVMDEMIARNFEKENSGIVALPPFNMVDYAIALKMGNDSLNDEISGAIKAMKENGELQALQSKWFGDDENAKTLPDFELSGEKGVLRVATTTQAGAPFVYVKDNVIVGYDIELVYNIAKMLGYSLNITDVDTSGIFETLDSNKADIATACLTASEERKQSVLFTEPIFSAGELVLVRTTNAKTDNNSFIEDFKDSFYKTFIAEDRYKLILNGLGVTLVISLLSLAFGTLLGAFVCAARMSRKRLFNIPAKIYVRIIQGTPIVVILMILYYILFASVDVLPLLIAVLGFSLNFAAYSSEMFRTAIMAVDSGQIEAARAIGYNKLQTFLKITLPQAARQIIPVFKGEFISMVKMTSVVGYIAIQDLTKASDIIRSRTYEAFFPLICTAIIYFVITYLLVMGLQYVETSIDPKRRRRIIKGVKNGGVV